MEAKTFVLNELGQSVHAVTEWTFTADITVDEILTADSHLVYLIVKGHSLTQDNIDLDEIYYYAHNVIDRVHDYILNGFQVNVCDHLYEMIDWEYLAEQLNEFWDEEE